MRTLDRILGWLMFLSGVAQAALALAASRSNTQLLTLSLGFALLIFLLGAANLMRAERPHDQLLARLCVFGNFGVLLLCVEGAAAFSDKRIWIAQALISLALLPLSMRTRRRSRPM